MTRVLTVVPPSSPMHLEQIRRCTLQVDQDVATWTNSFAGYEGKIIEKIREALRGFGNEAAAWRCNGSNYRSYAKVVAVEVLVRDAKCSGISGLIHDKDMYLLYWRMISIMSKHWMPIKSGALKE